MRFYLLARTLTAAGILGFAAMTASAGDAGQGGKLAYACLGCHGVENYKNAYPKYSVPKLGGQNAAYLEAALGEYASGNRWHPTMRGYANTLLPAERADIAAYFSSVAEYGAAQDGGKDVSRPAKAELCVACHGQDGAGTLDEYPNIGGQHADYIRQALHDYRNGKRRNPVMAPFAQQLTDQDIEALAEYFDRKPGLVTPELP